MHVQTHPQSTVHSCHVASHMADMEADWIVWLFHRIMIIIVCFNASLLAEPQRVQSPVQSSVQVLYIPNLQGVC